MNQKVTYTNK